MKDGGTGRFRMSYAQDHDRIQRIVRLRAKREEVWALIGAFGALADWHPLIAEAELTEIGGDLYRQLTTTDGENLLERLLEEGDHFHRYATVESNLPMSDHRATLTCVAEQGGCRVFWSAYFEPSAGDERLSDGIVAKYYEIGLAALVEKFG